MYSNMDNGIDHDDNNETPCTRATISSNIHQDDINYIGQEPTHQYEENLGFFYSFLFLWNFSLGNDVVRNIRCYTYRGQYLPMYTHP